MIYRLLLVEDSEESKDLVCHTLGQNFDIVWTSSLKQALQYINENQFDLILLDVDLPDGDGFRFFSTLINDTQYKKTPVIFLTASGNVADKVLGISLGAEDYIVKPFEIAEFKARVEMRVKKNNSQKMEDLVYRRGKLEISLSAQRAFLLEEGKKVDIRLTTLEFKLLTVLSQHVEHVFSRNQLFDMVWGADTHLTDRCVDTHIYSLRKKLRDFSGSIQSVYGEGYRFSLDFVKSKK